jgi:hypothetical protein
LNVEILLPVRVKLPPPVFVKLPPLLVIVPERAVVIEGSVEIVELEVTLTAPDVVTLPVA